MSVPTPAPSAAPRLRLYSFFRSTCSWRVRIALAHKAIPFELVPVHLARDGGEQHGDAYRSVNPMAQVPTLEIVRDGGIERIAQSVAILEWLEESYPAWPLLPADRALRARTRTLVELVNSGVQPLQNSGVLRHLKHALGADELAWARHFTARGMAAVEATAAASAGRFAVGDQVTLADVCIVPQLANARRWGVELSAFPTLLRIEAAASALPAFFAAHPDRQPDREA